jgi:subtilisin family serine protease
MIKRILQTTARFILILTLLFGFPPILGTTSIAQAKPPEIARQAQSGTSNYAMDHVLVKLRAPTSVTPQSLEQGITGNSKLDLTLAQTGGHSLEPLFVASPSVIKDRSGLGRIYRVDLDAGQNVQDTLALLQADPNVEYAEPDYIAHPVTAPNDPRYSEQWGLAKIQAEGAWDQTNGSPSVIIAVVDSGIDLTHEDLVDNLWVNPGEIPGNGIDDDNNGFVDDVQGWNFVAGSNNVTDVDGHGTQTAGVAAARTGNSKGIAGVCGLCRIMPVKVMQAGIANYSDIAAGINYAVVKGAKVINLSLGGYSDSKALQDAVDSALAQNVVVVAGAGNENKSDPFYPAAYAGVISVAATDSSDHKASFSNFGTWVKVSAPGVDVLTTDLGGGYVTSSGTSQASSFVAGMAGLLVTLHPDWAPTLVLAQLTRTADGIDGLNPGFEGKLGAGRINATEALQPAVPILSYVGYGANGIVSGRPDFNTDATLTVSLKNNWANALGVSGILSTTDPEVTVNSATAGFGDILYGQTNQNGTPFAIHISASAGYNHAIPFSLLLTANGGAYTVSLDFSVTTRSSEHAVSGTIATDTTWTNDKTFVATGDVSVDPGVTLTIQPGTTVKFDDGFSLNVGGTLIADGTESQPIRFLANTASAWGQIYFDDPSQDAVTDVDGTYQSGDILRWVQIDGASQGIACNKSTPFLSHVTTDGGGVNCTSGNTPLRWTDNDLTGNVTINNPPNSGWTMRAGLHTDRAGLGAATASNGKIYAIGGWGEGIPEDRPAVEEYDPATNVWTTRSSMPAPRSNLGVVAATNGKIYAIGGDGGQAAVEEYDPATDTWATRASMPTPRSFLGVAAASNGKIYAIGGDGIGTVEEYDPATDTWATRAYMPTPRSGLGIAAANNGKIYAVGGYSGSSPVSTVEEYDPATDTWATRTSMPTPRGGLGVVTASNGKIYAIGGDGMIDAVEEYDPVTDTWTTRTGMLNPRGRFGVASASNGKIYVIGGFTVNPTGGVDEFDPPAGGLFILRNTTIRLGSLSLPGNSQVLNSAVSGKIFSGGSDPGIIIQNSTAGGIVINGSGMVSNNIINGGISIVRGQVLSNTLTGGGISVGDDMPEVNLLIKDNIIENAPGWGIESSSSLSVTIEHNRLVGATWGIFLQNGSISGNLIANVREAGIVIGDTMDVSDNTMTGIAGTAIRAAWGTPTIHANNLEFNTGAYDLENDTTHTLDVSGNWWGTTDPAVIGGRIKGLVTFDPTLTGPSQTAPAYARSLTVDPNPVGIQRATFTFEFSRPMDITRNPSITFRLSDVDKWQTKARMPTGRSLLGVVAAANGHIYAIGGYNSRYLSMVEEYNPSTDTWTTKAYMPTPRMRFGVAASSNGKIYAIGGTDSGPLATVEEYDPSTNTWTTKANLPVARDNVGVAAGNNGKIYAIGGFDTNGLAATVEEYDPITNNWTEKANMPTGFTQTGVVAANNGKIYAVGSVNNKPAFEEYDPAANTWAIKTPMPTPRSDFGLVATSDGRIFTIGGYTGSAPYNFSSVEEYNPGTDTWTTRASMPAARGFLGAAVAGNGKIYAIGGYYEGNYLTTVEEYTPARDLVFYEAAANPQWEDTTHYRATYDFTSLNPRGAYQAIVQDAWGSDGLEIAPSQGNDFVVDYAGSISVTTPPNTPLVSAWNNGNLTALSARWTATDSHAAITGYSYAIGTTPGGTDVVNWTNVSGTSLTRAGLHLTQGQKYYVSIKARNEGGLWSQAGASNAVKAGIPRIKQFIPMIRKTN